MQKLYCTVSDFGLVNLLAQHIYKVGGKLRERNTWAPEWKWDISQINYTNDIVKDNRVDMSFAV